MRTRHTCESRRCTNYIRFDTMKAFASIQQNASAKGVLEALARADDFKHFVLRRDQKKWLNQVNWKDGRWRNKSQKNRVQSVPDKASSSMHKRRVVVAIFFVNRLPHTDEHLIIKCTPRTAHR